MATLLVGVDPGESSTRAVKFAVERAKLLQADIVIVHVINWSPFSFNTPSENEERHVRRREEVEAARQQIIEPMVKLVEDSGQGVQSVVQHGNPARTMIELAHNHEAEQIVVGRTGESPLHEAIFGGVVSRLAQASPVPVTVVP